MQDLVTIKKQPQLPSLSQQVSLSCGAMGNITWFKDGVLIPGARSREFVIMEVEVSDRGRYSCKINIDPNILYNIYEVTSVETVVNIQGI